VHARKWWLVDQLDLVATLLSESQLVDDELANYAPHGVEQNTWKQVVAFAQSMKHFQFDHAISASETNGGACHWGVVLQILF
jgi:phage I-like protein